MKCDSCGKDNDYFGDLMWNGRYRHSDTLFTEHKHKMMVCADCWNAEFVLKEKYPDLYDGSFRYE